MVGTGPSGVLVAASGLVARGGDACEVEGGLGGVIGFGCGEESNSFFFEGDLEEDRVKRERF